MYANVDNCVEVSTEGGMHHVALAVPTGLFTIMRDAFKVPVEATVTLSIDQQGERYVFSLLHGYHLYDLWDYSQASLPGWIVGLEHRIVPA